MTTTTIHSSPFVAQRDPLFRPLFPGGDPRDCVPPSSKGPVGTARSAIPFSRCLSSGEGWIGSTLNWHVRRRRAVRLARPCMTECMYPPSPDRTIERPTDRPNRKSTARTRTIGRGGGVRRESNTNLIFRGESDESVAPLEGAGRCCNNRPGNGGNALHTSDDASQQPRPPSILRRRRDSNGVICMLSDDNDDDDDDESYRNADDNDQ
jgi:hypothetical protein